MKISASIQASNIYNLLDELENYKDSFDQLHVDIQTVISQIMFTTSCNCGTSKLTQNMLLIHI